MAATATWITFTITQLELLHNELSLGMATGFFLKENENWFLATNWHVLSGRDNSDGQPRHTIKNAETGEVQKTGATPNRCRFYTASLDQGKLKGTLHDIAIGDATLNTAIWYEHPVRGQEVDVAILPLTNFKNGLIRDLLELTNPKMNLDLGAEIFLPGYPLGLSALGMPLWKRASLASSLDFGHGINKYVYVDTATREGMSGAPCIAVPNRPYYERTGEGMKMKLVTDPVACRLIGIYSGRKNPSDSFEAQIGVVWRENLILETILGKKLAAVKFN